MTRTLIALAALAALATPAATFAAGQDATPHATPTPRETSIPFVSFGNIYSFQADGDDAVYLQNRARQWYRATFNGPCNNMPFAVRIAVDTRYGGSQLDRTGRIYVDGEQCWIASLVKSDPPPKREKRKR
jgi:hypothetical protein